jgi:hypothetical protein
MKRIVIYPSDIIVLTDKSESHARKEIQRVKAHLKKASHQKITIKEYCSYFGFDLDEVMDALSGTALKKVS